ncbi:MAG: hypothetical protein AB1593_12220 [Pseudomonadota bacterium]
MSRWSAEPLRIALAPGEVALARGARRHTVPAGRDATSLVPVLDAALADDAWQTTRVEVVLSQHFVRHVLTPPPGKPLSPVEEQALVAASLRDIYGDLAAHWAVRVYSQPPHAGLAGAAIDAELAQALDALLARRGFRRIAIRPFASVAARRAPVRLEGWWVLVEPGWLSLFGGAQGCWQHVAGLPIDGRWQDTLPEWLERERGSAAASIPNAVWLHASGMGAVVAPNDARMRWHVLPHDARLSGASALLAA